MANSLDKESPPTNLPASFAIHSCYANFYDSVHNGIVKRERKIILILNVLSI